MKCLIPLAGLLIAFATAAPASASLVANHDFETDNGEVPIAPLSWFFGGPVAYELADDSDGNGSRSAEITASTGDFRSEAIFVTPGDELIWSLDYKFLDGASGEFSADLRFFSGFDPVSGGTAGAFRGEQRIVVSSTSQGVWETLGPNTFEVPAGALTADVRISSGFFDGGLSGGGIRIDNIQVEVPEPSTIALIACAGLVPLAARRRRS